MRGNIVLDIKVHYTVIKTLCYWGEMNIDQQNRIENPETDPQKYAEPTVDDNIAKAAQWKKDSLFNKRCWSNGKSMGGEMDLYLNSDLIPYTKILHSLKCKMLTIKVLE